LHTSGFRKKVNYDNLIIDLSNNKLSKTSRTLHFAPFTINDLTHFFIITSNLVKEVHAEIIINRSIYFTKKSFNNWEYFPIHNFCENIELIEVHIDGVLTKTYDFINEIDFNEFKWRSIGRYK
jgi:hypothetical protein